MVGDPPPDLLGDPPPDLLPSSFSHSGGCFEDIPCSFEDFLSRNWPHLVHRVLEVGVAPLLLVRDGAKNVDLFRLLEDDLLDMGTSIWLYLKHHGTGHHVC